MEPETKCEWCKTELKASDLKLFVNKQRVCKACHNAHFESGE